MALGGPSIYPFCSPWIGVSRVIFISEDDVVIQSPLAVAGYTASMAASGWGHLAFHAHGPANDGGPVEGAEFPPGVTYWPNYVGAWCCYTREALTVGGLMDGGDMPVIVRMRWNA